MQEFMTIAEAARVLRCDPRTVRRWAEEKLFPTVRPGKRKMLIPKDAFEKFVASRKR